MGAEPPRRVLFLAPSYHPRAGGEEKQVRCVTRELTNLGLEARIAAPRWQEDWPESEIVDGVQVLRLHPRAAQGRRQLAPLVERADIVHTHDAYPFLKYYLPFRLRRPRLPAYVTLHGYEAYPIPTEAKVLRRLVLWLTKGSLCAGTFIPKWYGFRCAHITHGGVDAPPQRPPLGEGAVFVGRLEPDTGFVAYLKALRTLKQDHGISLPLTVCGDGSLRLQGEHIAASADLAVTFLGRVPDPMPYLTGARYALTSGLLSMLEAMAAGTLVFALYDNPLKEDYLRLFPGAEHAVIAGSPAGLAEGLLRLHGSPDLAEQQAEGAYGFARTQTWERVARLYLDLWGVAAP